MELAEKAKSLPLDPGVYLFRDDRGDIMYVGKAASLRQRVKSYFQSPKSLAARILSMVTQARDLDFIVTASEVEALILESNLIKKHHPKYNIRLRDDKHYPYLRVTLGEEWPRVLIARSMKQDGSRYFGPYTRAGAVSETVRIIRRIFPLRTCSDSTFRTVDRPCLNYHIKRCLGACKGLVSQEEYRAMFRDICLFLEGRPEVLAQNVRQRMEQAAENLEFEKAAKLRDQLKAIREVTERQRIISDKIRDRDIIGVALAGTEAVVIVLQVRDGKMTGAEQVSFSGPETQTAPEVVDAFLTQYYQVTPEIPDEVLLPAEPEDVGIVEEWLSGVARHKVRVKAPARGDAKGLVDMAAKNAALALDEITPRVERERDRARKGLQELAGALGIPAPPVRVECYDISNIQGRHPVGSMVVFEEGMPKKEDYRRFKVKWVEGPNDFAMMAEVVERRFKRGLRERAEDDAKGSFASFPDLLMVDGGKGQLSSATEVLTSLGLDIFSIGLAKQEEEVFLPGRPDSLKLPRDSLALQLLQRIRDEAHRFAVGYHRKVRTRESRRSILDEIPGIGPKRRSALLRRFGSIKAIAEAPLEDLARVKGMNEPAARRVLDHLTSRLSRAPSPSQV